MKKMILGSVVSLLVVAPALAGVSLNWQSNDYGTYQAWTFVNRANQSGGGQNWQSVPETDQNPYGDPVANIFAQTLCPGTAMSLGWNATDNVGTQGLYYGHNYNASGVGLRFEVEIPNLANEDLFKLVEIQWVYAGTFIGGGLTADGKASLISDTGSVEIDDSPYFSRTQVWSIDPQPGSETIWLTFNGSGGFLDSVEIATVCNAIPAPGAVLLGSLGIGLIGWLRRRHTL